MARRPPPRTRLLRPRLTARWIAVAAFVLIALLYYRPARSYFDTKAALARRSAEVERLTGQRQTLQRRLAASTTAEALVREARKLGYVRPGERLFIVKGIERWRRDRANAGRRG